MSTRRLFVGGPWDGQVKDLDGLVPDHARWRQSVVVPLAPTSFEVATYHAREIRWRTDEDDAVKVIVMCTSMTGPATGPLLRHLFSAAGIDVQWQSEESE